MEVDSSAVESRFQAVCDFLGQPGSDCPNSNPNFGAGGSSNLECIRSMKILVVGAGGLGCELLKDLALMGFYDLHVIDMDTIDVSNLNRQFLFRPADVGRPKAEVAAEFIHNRIPECKVTPHFCPIEKKDQDFYQSFRVIVCGLDSVQARRWLNNMICSLLVFDDDGNVDPSTVRPMVDGGTEGFRGSARLVVPTMTPCIECELDLYPPQVNFPLCTIAHTPRLPEHCVEYVRVLLWPKERPFEGANIDGDDPAHVKWILQRALERANEYGITGVDYRLTQGVVKRIMPAVASTNAAIAAICAQEVFKLATECACALSNYMQFQDGSEISMSVLALGIKDDCLACRATPSLKASFAETLDELRSRICKQYQLKEPGLFLGRDGTTKPLFIPAMEARQKENLKKTLKELGFVDDCYLVVADRTLPSSRDIRIREIDS